MISLINAHENLLSAFNNAMPFPPESTQMPPISPICVHAAETCEIPANWECVIWLRRPALWNQTNNLLQDIIFAVHLL